MPCSWTPDDAGYVALDEAAQNTDCPIPEGVRGFTVPSLVVDKHGHVLDGDFDPKGAGGCDHRNTPEWKAEHRRKPQEKVMSDVANPAIEEKHDAIAVPPPAPQSTATVSVDTAIAQVKSLAPEGASAGLLIGGAAVLAVIGAGIKFGPQMLKSRAEAAEREHEREMKRLELEEKKSQQNDDQHGKCSVERAALEAKVASLESSLSDTASKLSKVEEAAKAAGEKAAPMGDFDADELEERLAKLEKALKPAAKSKAKAKGRK